MAASSLSSELQLGEKEFHIAPMLDVSTIEFRYFIRILTKRAVLWTEMVVAETLVHRSRHNSIGDTDIHLDLELKRHCGWFDERDHCDETNDTRQFVNPHPIVCQIGTNNPKHAEFATRVAQACGYDRIDLNAECPSDRVSGKREFGAALMRDKDTAINVVRSMIETSGSIAVENSTRYIPVSVKTRIGVDDFDSFEHLLSFVQRLVDAGCRRFIVHARKVYTQGLSPAQNRTVPPLNYPFVYQLIERFPKCDFWINGGIMNLQHARKIAYGQCTEFNGMESSTTAHEKENATCYYLKHTIPCEFCNMPHGSCIVPPKKNLPNLRGVMVGRLARDNPAALADIDRYFYGDSKNPCNNRREIMENYIEFIERIYPRRCCDDNDVISSRMAIDMQEPIVHSSLHCSICCDYQQVATNEFCDQVPVEVNKLEEVVRTGSNAFPDQAESKRFKKHFQKYGKAKIVSGIIDSALQPTLGILYGQRGNNLYRRELHRLSRDMAVRNCGPAYILRKAMAVISSDVWDRPFTLNETETNYIPSR